MAYFESFFNSPCKQVKATHVQYLLRGSPCTVTGCRKHGASPIFLTFKFLPHRVHTLFLDAMVSSSRDSPREISIVKWF